MSTTHMQAPVALNQQSTPKSCASEPPLDFSVYAEICEESKQRLHEFIDSVAWGEQYAVRSAYKAAIVAVDMGHLTRFSCFGYDPASYRDEVTRCAKDRKMRNLKLRVERREIRIPDFIRNAR